MRDEIESDGCGDRAYESVEKAVPCLHKNESEKTETELFKPSGNGDAVDDGKGEEDENDVGHRGFVDDIRR